MPSRKCSNPSRAQVLPGTLKRGQPRPRLGPPELTQLIHPGSQDPFQRIRFSGQLAQLPQGVDDHTSVIAKPLQLTPGLLLGPLGEQPTPVRLTVRYRTTMQRAPAHAAMPGPVTGWHPAGPPGPGQATTRLMAWWLWLALHGLPFPGSGEAVVSPRSGTSRDHGERCCDSAAP